MIAEAHQRTGAYLGRYWPSIPLSVREELTQAAVLKLLEQRELPRSPIGWTVGVARNFALHWWRDEGRPRLDLSYRTEPVEEIDVAARLDGWKLRLLIATAPARYRGILEHLYVREDDLAALVDTELAARGEDPSDLAARNLVQHVVYGRRKAALKWLRAHAGIQEAA